MGPGRPKLIGDPFKSLGPFSEYCTIEDGVPGFDEIMLKEFEGMVIRTYVVLERRGSQKYKHFSLLIKYIRNSRRSG